MARVLLLCSSRFALQTMQELAFYGQLAGVAIPAHCDEWLDNAHAALQAFGTPVIVLDRERYVLQLEEAIAHFAADTALMASFSFRIPERLFEIPSNGFFNLHPGPLPGYRGPDPVFWQILNREQRACVTLHRLDAGWDTGPVVMREEIALRPDETYGLLSQQLSVVAAKLAQQLIRMLGFGLPLPLRAQDSSKAVYQKRQTAADVSIRWDAMNASQIVALINACNPWNKGATTRFTNRVIRFVEAEALPLVHGAAPGTILQSEHRGLLIACREDSLLELRIVACDEGIFAAAKLVETGIRPGMRFDDF